MAKMIRRRVQDHGEGRGVCTFRRTSPRLGRETIDAPWPVAYNLPHMWDHAFGPDWGRCWTLADRGLVPADVTRRCRHQASRPARCRPH